MKKIFILLTGLCLLASCKKHNEQPRATGELNGMWRLAEAAEDEMENGQLTHTVFQSKPSDSFNFRTDGTLTAIIQGEQLDFDYSIHGDSCILSTTGYVIKSAFHIESLTNSSMTLHGKTAINQIDYTEVWYHLTK